MDGIHIRPIGPGDREALAAGFSRLSEESRYRRFFAPVARLSESQLRYLTDVDHRDHEALIAYAEETGEAVGVARFVRTGEREAEPAVTVVDAWQGRGVASALLDELADRAREEDIDTFIAPVLAGNTAAVAALRRLGDTTVESQGREVEVRIRLRSQAGAPVSLRRMLRQVAEESIQPAVSMFQRVAALGRAPGAPPANLLVVEAPPTRRVRPAVPQAMRLAAALGAEVHLVSVAAGDRLAEVGGELRGRGLTVVEYARRGDLAAALLDVAVETRARLIVVDGAPVRGLMPSAWEHVSHHAPCDVLVAR